jgi:hypothetical protein
MEFSMDLADSNARIVLTRERGGWRDRFRGYAVMIDEKEVGKVRRGERHEFAVTPGHHRIFLKVDWCKSPTLEVDAEPHDVIQMSCAPGGSALAGPGAVVGNIDSYISLTRS